MYTWITEKKPLWQSYDGAIRSFDAMEDEHLANVICHMNHYRNAYTDQTRMEAMKEVARRGLSEKFLAGALYPFRDKVTGDWLIWSFDEAKVVKVKDLANQPKPVAPFSGV